MDRVLLSIGKVNIYWYSVLVILGIICALLVIKREAKKQNVDKEFITNLAFFTIIIGVLGARIYYCLFNFDYYANNLGEIFKI